MTPMAPQTDSCRSLKLWVEDCARLNPQRDLVATGQVQLGRRSTGLWMGHEWEALVRIPMKSPGHSEMKSPGVPT
jgi:hypothetical protein